MKMEIGKSEIEIDDRCDRFESLCEQGLLTHGRWTGTDEQGRDTFCWLAALAPECAAEESVSVCPAELMPEWAARCVTWIADKTEEDSREAREIQFGALVRRFTEMDDAGWKVARYRVMSALRRQHGLLDGYRDDDGMLALLERIGDGLTFASADSVCDVILAAIRTTIQERSPDRVHDAN